MIFTASSTSWSRQEHAQQGIEIHDSFGAHTVQGNCSLAVQATWSWDTHYSSSSVLSQTSGTNVSACDNCPRLSCALFGVFWPLQQHSHSVPWLFARKCWWLQHFSGEAPKYGLLWRHYHYHRGRHLSRNPSSLTAYHGINRFTQLQNTNWCFEVIIMQLLPHPTPPLSQVWCKHMKEVGEQHFYWYLPRQGPRGTGIRFVYLSWIVYHTVISQLFFLRSRQLLQKIILSLQTSRDC